MRLLPTEKLLKSKRGVYLTTMLSLDSQYRMWYVYDADHDEYDTEPSEHATLADAEARYLDEVKYATSQPDWAAQARYDDEHGTSNGYDERIEDMLAMRNREAGEY